MTAKQFRSALESLGLSQRDLAKELDVTPNTVWRWASGAQPVPKVVALAMAYLELKSTGRDE
jgi:transcriptional regulator with XRE-family HTH domain